jgi:hypothetical protein
MDCIIRDELSAHYCLALDQAKDARRKVIWAVTNTQLESASTRMARVEGHRLFAIGELLSHCEQHQCATPEVQVLFSVVQSQSCSGELG